MGTVGRIAQGPQWQSEQMTAGKQAIIAGTERASAQKAALPGHMTDLAVLLDQKRELNDSVPGFTEGETILALLLLPLGLIMVVCWALRRLQVHDEMAEIDKQIAAQP